MRLIFLCCAVLWWQSAQATIIHIGQSGQPATLKLAVTLAQPMDTIIVPSGTYTEGNILIQKSLHIIGKNLPVLDGKLKFEIFTIAAKNVTIEGFKFINSGRSSMEDLAGIKCLDAHHVTIKNNIFENTFFGIHLSNSNFSRILNNKMSASAELEYQLGNGIHLWKCTNAEIVGNQITGHRDGIYFEFVTKSSIRKNISQKNKRYGLHFMFSHDDSYEDNVFRNNGAGVSVMYTRHVKMLRNTFEDNWGSSAYGLLLKDIGDSEVLNNKFIGNTSGIYMEGTSRTKFERNVFLKNGWAIKLQASCDGNTFEYNNFQMNTFDISTNGSLVLNTMEHNYWDKYEGYDLDRNGIGDIPFHPVSLFSVITERIPSAMLIWRSFLVYLLDKAEKVVPVMTPENLRDNLPQMRPHDFG
jgi:nitrous oxidase accessory protein